MTVYKPKSGRLWHYDFQFKGVRYHGSTGCAGKRDAEKYERDTRIETTSRYAHVHDEDIRAAMEKAETYGIHVDSADTPRKVHGWRKKGA